MKQAKSSPPAATPEARSTQGAVLVTHDCQVAGGATSFVLLKPVTEQSPPGAGCRRPLRAPPNLTRAFGGGTRARSVGQGAGLRKRLKNSHMARLALMSSLALPYGQPEGAPGQQCPMPCKVHTWTSTPSSHSVQTLQLELP